MRDLTINKYYEKSTFIQPILRRRARLLQIPARLGESGILWAGFHSTEIADRMRSTKDQTSAPSSSEHRQMHIRLGLLGIAVIINVLGFSIIIPIAPTLIARQGHLAPLDPLVGEYNGWLIAIYALMQFFFAPIWGRLSDRIGRKPLLLASLAGDIIFYSLFALAHTIPQLFAARILAGIFSSGTLSIAQAYAADITPPDQRAVGLGILGACFGLGFVFGPAIGGALGHFNLQLPLFAAAFFALVNLIYIAKLLPESLVLKQEAAQAGPPASVLSRLALMGKAVAGPVGFLYMLTFAVTFAFANLEGTFSPYLMQHFPNINPKNSVAVQGAVFTYIGILIVLIQGGAIRPLVKRYGEGPLVIAGIGLMAAGFLLFPLAPTLAALLLGPLIPISVGNGLNSPALRALISRRAAATSQGAMLGLSASFDSLARATGPAVGAWTYARFGQHAPYWLAGAVMALCLVATVLRRDELMAVIPAGGESAPTTH